MNEPQAIPVTAPKLAPVTSDERLDVMDILRGFALIGILVMNIEWFGRPIAGLHSFDLTLTGGDHAAGWLVRWLVEGKFYKLFSLLFGMGFAVMLLRAEKAGRPFKAWFFRRMLVMFLIGILHYIFIFTGDILNAYAAGGVVLLLWLMLFRTKKLEKRNTPGFFGRFALTMLLIPLLGTGAVAVFDGLTRDGASYEELWAEQQEVAALVEAQLALPPPAEDEAEAMEDSTGDTVAAADDAADESADDSETAEDEDSVAAQVEEWVDWERKKESTTAEEFAALAEGTYAEATAWRWKQLPQELATVPFFAILILLPVFLIGYWLIASGILPNHRQHPSFFRWLTGVGFLVGLPISAYGLALAQQPVFEIVDAIGMISFILSVLGEYLVCVGYLGAIVWLSMTKRGARVLSALAPMGRMALTNYIGQTLILSILFYGYGFGLYGQVGRANQMLVCLAILVFQGVFSALWLKVFRFGPLEWVWRSLTYMSWQPMRKAA